MKKAPHEEKIRHLLQYPWSRCRASSTSIDYDMVLAEYGGDTDNARRKYRKRIIAEIAEGIVVKENILGQSILGQDEFIDWVTVKFLKGKKDGKRPSMFFWLRDLFINPVVKTSWNQRSFRGEGP